MKSNTIICSFDVDRDVYNTFKSIIAKQGENVKDNIVSYIESVIRYECTNAETILAINEVESLKNEPNKRVYKSFSEVLDKLDEDESKSDSV